MGPSYMANRANGTDDRGPLYTTWREIHEKGSEEFMEIIALITGGNPPGISTKEEKHGQSTN